MEHRSTGDGGRRRPATGRAGARFPRPLDVPTPPGAEGWEELYPYSLPFSADRREHEEAAFWFRDTIHWPRPLSPFEAAFVQYAFTALGQFNHRHYLVPAARGVEVRVLHGHCYLSPTSIDDPMLVAERRAAFAQRAGHLYEHWDERYAAWMTKVRTLLDTLGAVTFPSLPDVVPFDEVVSGRGLGRPYDLTHAFHRVLDLGAELWQYHFELLNLGYAAYLDYFALCRRLDPGITELAVAEMVSGIDIDLFRPDRELRRLARLAMELDVADAVCDGTVDGLAGRLLAEPRGLEWLRELEDVQQPWFNYTSGSGFYHDDPVWIDRLDIPFGYLTSYIAHLQAGAEIDAPVQAVADERDRLTEAFRAQISGEDLAEFDRRLALARRVFPFVENHNFYVEHWGMSLLWRKMRELSAIFVKDGFWNAVDDIFFLRTDEIDAALWDMVGAWANGSPARGPQRWPAEVARRRAIVRACAATPPPRALGEPPAVVTEPFTVMLWGVTSDAVAVWLDEVAADEHLSGFAASPGVVVGRARVVRSADELDDVQDGEVLVAVLTSPSWAPVFSRIAGTVTEVGGMMSHVAIVCREYGLPAVTGVAGATTSIRTGQLLRVDGDTGRVSVVG